MIRKFHQIFFGLKTENKEMGFVYNPCEWDQRRIQGFGGENFNYIRKLQVEAPINVEISSVHLSRLSSQQNGNWLCL